MRTLTALVFLSLISFGAVAQSGKLKQAQQKMDNLEYMDAIELYNQILENGDVSEAKINLAEAYRKVNDTPNAEFWYGQVVRLPESEAIHKLYYGMMLQRNSKCDIAREWYQQFVDSAPDDQRGQLLLRACDYEDELMTKSAGIFEVKEVDFNSSTDDFSPQFYKGGLVFTSERDTNPIIRRTHAWTNQNFLELYYVDMRETGTEEGCGNYVFGRPEKFSNEINTKFHDAAVAFSRNGEEIFFTRNNFLEGKKDYDDDGIMRLKVFYARSEGEGSWGDLQSLPFNSNEYSVAHPTLSADASKLYFTSDMPGGFGGMDLYVSEKESGRWGPPTNLGPDINTEGHELFPYVDAEGKVYFSSDGHIGLGGLDIYYTSQDEGGTWKTPENMGYPVNTLSDDFGVIFNVEGTCGFFSSDRDGGLGGDDIYTFKKTAIPVEVLVYDEKTDLPIEGALVEITCKGDSVLTDAEGKVSFDMKLNDCCDLKASMESYNPNESEACTNDLTLADKMEVKIPLKREAEFEIEGIVFDGLNKLPMEGATVTIENDCGQPLAEPFVTTSTGRYYFKLDKECCYKVKATQEGYFAGIAEDVCTRGLEDSETLVENLFLMPTTTAPYDPSELVDKEPGSLPDGSTETDYTYLDSATRLWMDKDTRLPADGKYDDGREYEKGVLIVDEFPYSHIPKQEVDSGENQPTAPGIDPPIVNTPPDVTTLPGPGGGDKGGPVSIPYLLHIYYDFDQAYIRNEAIPELEKLLNLMQENTQYIIEIGSHTDARGSYHYNNRLSQRRADSVVKWLVGKGIERERLVARGYGENVNVNDCVNNVPCSEGQHQMNRRTEFKVIGCRDCEKSNEILSKANPNPKVDRCDTCPF